MSRPKRRGLLYYSRDIDHFTDDRVFELMYTYGPLGCVVYDAVLSIVYREGYYIETDKNRMVNRIIHVIGNRWVESRQQVVDIVELCARLGLIDAQLLEKGVVTSKDIQRIYSAALNRCRFNKEKYWLLDDGESESVTEQDGEVFAAETPPDPPERGVFATETPLNPPEGGVIVTETPPDPPERGVYVTETPPDPPERGVYVTETPPDPPERDVYVTEMYLNKTKEKETKQKESRVNKTQQNKTAPSPGDESGLDEMCCDIYTQYEYMIKPMTGVERMRLEGLCMTYGTGRVASAVSEAASRGGRSVAYVAKILRSCYGGQEPSPAGELPPDEGEPGPSGQGMDTVINGMYTHIHSPSELREINDLLDRELYDEFEHWTDMSG